MAEFIYNQQVRDVQPLIQPSVTPSSSNIITSPVRFLNTSIEGDSTIDSSLVNPNIANRGWVQTSAFSVTDADTVGWGAGTFTSADGTAYSIGGGNTGNMAAKTYIYLDIATSVTAYQVTTTASTAVGAGKVLIAIAQNATGEAKFMVMNDNSYNIDAANIVANSITANELSTSITYAGEIVISTAGMIRSGQTAFNTGTGWFIGNDGGTPKLSIGDGGSSNYLTWDGTSLVINGFAQTNQGSFGGDGSDGALTITSGTTTIDLSSAKYVVKNYSSVSITGSGKLGFSNPASTGTIVVIKCRDSATITSSSTSVIDLRGIGAAAGTGGAIANSGTAGTTSTGLWSPTFNNGGAGSGADPTAVGAGGVAATAAQIDVWITGTGNSFKIGRKAIFLTPGSGGGGGGGSPNEVSTTKGAGGAGGAGGGVLFMEIGGALNFTTGSIDVSGNPGVAAASVTAVDDGSSSSSGGGGGGGSAGMCLIMYNSLTANTGTIIAKGGVGGGGGPITGTGGNNGAPRGGAGGGGAAGYGGAGGAGGAGAPTQAGTNTNGSNGTSVTDLGAGGGGGGGGGCDVNGSHALGGSGGGSVGDSVVQLVLLNSEFA